MPIKKPSLLTDPVRAFSPVGRTTAPAASNGHARKRSVLSTLARGFASPSKRGNRSPVDRAMSPLQLSQPVSESFVTGASQITLQTSSDSQSQAALDHTQAVEPSSHQSALLASQLSNLSNYLSALTTIAEVRRSETWQRFFAVQGDDSASSHLEGAQAARQPSQVSSLRREPKRIKSEASLLTSKASSIKKDHRPQLAQGVGQPDDPGIGGDTSLFSSQGAGPRLSASVMKREASTATTGSNMSIFVEDVPSGAVGDPEVLAYMSQIPDARSAEHPEAEKEDLSHHDGMPSETGADCFGDPLHAHDWHSLKSNIVEQDEDIASPTQRGSPVAERASDGQEVLPLSATTAVETLAEYAAMHDSADHAAVDTMAPGTGLLTPASDDEDATARIEAELEAHMVKLEQEVEARKAAGTIPQAKKLSESEVVAITDATIEVGISICLLPVRLIII